jgi:glycerol-3-phosphate O-acyltransferase
MNEINRVTSVTPSALVATALLTHGKRGLPHGELVRACERLAHILQGEGARFSPSLVVGGAAERSPEELVALRAPAIREACELLVRAGHIEVHSPGTPVGARDEGARPGFDAIYVVPDVGRLSLDIAKNLVVHFFVSRAMIATPLAAAARAGEATIPSARLAERVQALSRLFKYELQFRADASFETIFAETLALMQGDHELIVAEGNVRLATSGEGHERAQMHARMLRNFVEGYRVAARGLAALLKGPLAPKDLAKRAMTAGERMFLAGELECREAVNRPVVDNAFLAFVDQGYLGRREGKYVLPESYATAEAVRTIEARIASFL